MNFGVINLMAAIFILTIAPSAFATKADYCAVYAHDFADSKTQDKALWQHKYEIAMTYCLAEQPTAEQTKKPKTKIAVKTKTIEQKTASSAPRIVKLIKPSPAAATTQTKLEPGSEAWNNYCANKYASFNAKTGTYTSKTGVTRKCVVFYP